MSIDNALEDARDVATDFLNADGRDPRHVIVGVALTVGFALAATIFATRTLAPTRDRPGDGHAPVTERPRGPLSLILPAVFSVTTLSAVRVWNAPHARERTVAMGLWAGAQALNAVWIALRPAGRGLQIAAAMSSAGMAAAFAHEARKIDLRAGQLASPIGGRTRLANKVEDQATVH
ncbi:MAG: TspO protein [Brevundimonas sp.]|uniref:TspO protein n=1 Tax=Brevundimonas sp. TaxID=1871086 RepID=UPI00391AE16F